MMTRRGLLSGMMTAGLAVAVTGSGRAQSSYPDRPIKIILPYTPGSPNDVFARVAAPILSVRLKQTVVVDNRPGAGTLVGVKAVMTPPPDGYTLLFTNTPTHVIAQFRAQGIAYDPIGDFVPIVAVGITSLVLVVSPRTPADTLAEFIAYAKASPGKLNFGFGQGTLPHLIGEAFKIATGTDIVSIPYRGGAQAITDMLGGRVDMNFGAGATLLPLIRDRKIKALAVTSPARSAELPNVPTMIECGLPSLTTVTHYGFFGPSGIAADVVATLNREMNEGLEPADIRANMIKAGIEPTGGSPQDFAAVIAQQLHQWAPVVKATRFQLD
ncbi:MAG TPA: tripartite tricarboxylate transporter substrate binding protein [Xanthobacteraceae bacterium]|nr:tripartite tricarboxylate transporter substrate binding protein [Xanthobacteraceae bacterium]